MTKQSVEVGHVVLSVAEEIERLAEQRRAAPRPGGRRGEELGFGGIAEEAVGLVLHHTHRIEEIGEREQIIERGFEPVFVELALRKVIIGTAGPSVTFGAHEDVIGNARGNEARRVAVVMPVDGSDVGTGIDGHLPGAGVVIAQCRDERGRLRWRLVCHGF